MTPESFRIDLKRFDSRLDIVWNGQKALWQIVGKDRRNITYVIYDIPLGKIDQLGTYILESLYEMSPIKQGGAENVNRKIDDEIEKEEFREDRIMKDTFDMISAEAHDHLMRRAGLRINNISIPNDKRRIKLCP